MTPPASALALRAAQAPVTKVKEQPATPLACPAVPAAVILPPAALYLASIGLVTAVHALLTQAPSGWTLLRASVLAALLFPILYCVRVVIYTREVRARRFVLTAAAILVAFFFDWVLPGWYLHPITMATLVGCGLLLHRATTAWRTWWLAKLPLRVTLLAPDERRAASAMFSLRAIPGLIIVNVVVPDCDEEEAGRLLHRPVSASLDGSMDLERDVIVHNPTRHQALGGWIAYLVSRGHRITSHSRTLRNAEGRVDSTKVDALNLLLARPNGGFANASSRAMDILLSIVAVVVLTPVYAAVALAIRLEGPGPLLYVQERMGANGRLFRMFKFRSMRQDAEALSGPVWASERDPRITRVGAFIRKYRLDELPQFANVLVGNMALVGPRPERLHFCEALRSEVPLFELRAIVRPGITGWAQVRAPYAAASDEARVKLSYDLFYVTRRSPWFDIAILFETLGVALSGRGAR